MKPKTLKDLTGMIGMLPLKSDILDINVVKKEAIKIKKSINDWSNKGILHKEFRKLSGKNLNVDTFIKWFFNISEEDLQ